MKFKIGVRLTATFGAILALLLVICVIASLQLAHLNANTQTIVNDRAGNLKLENEAREAMLRIGLLAYRSLDEPTPEAQQADLEQIQAQLKQDEAIYQALGNRIRYRTGCLRSLHPGVRDLLGGHEAAVCTIGSA